MTLEDLGTFGYVYGLKPEVWGRVGPDPWTELQVNPGQPGVLSWYANDNQISGVNVCVALPEQANSHSSDASYHGEQGYNAIYLPIPQD